MRWLHRHYFRKIMGNKQGSRYFLSYEEAAKRLKADELDRLKNCFRRYSFNGDSLPFEKFQQYVFSGNVPATISRIIFEACGGSSYKDAGVSFRDLVVCLVILTKGDFVEKIKFLFNLFSKNGDTVDYGDLLRQICVIEGISQNDLPQQLTTKFRSCDTLNCDDFLNWVAVNEDHFTLTKWLLSNSPTLTSDALLPNFFQTLAGVTHLEEKEIAELDKHYWKLFDPKTNRLELRTFTQLVCPPLPELAVENLFLAFDDNRDQQIDFKELVCGMSACCRGPDSERHKFCFKLFDADNDGLMSSDEVLHMLEAFLAVHNLGSLQNSNQVSLSVLLEEVLGLQETDPYFRQSTLALEKFLYWCLENALVTEFLDLLFEVCHIVLGLRPASKADEYKIIRSWLRRENRTGYQVGQTWYPVSREWWTKWELNVAPPGELRSVASSPTMFTKYKRNGSDALAESVEQNVVITSFTSFREEDADSISLCSGRQPLDKEAVSHKTKLCSACSLSDVSSLDVNNGPLPARSWSPCPPRLLASAAADKNNLETSLAPSTSTVSLNSFASGPVAIDNSNILLKPKNANTAKLPSLTNDGGQLKPNLLPSEFQLVPEPVWASFCRWYGSVGHAVPRRVVLNPETRTPSLELYPAQIIFYKHSQTNNANNNSAAVGNLNSNNLNSPGYSSALGLLGVGTSTLSQISHGAVSSVWSYLSGNLPKRVPSYRATFSVFSTFGEMHRFLCERLRLNADGMRLWLLSSTKTASETVSASGFGTGSECVSPIPLENSLERTLYEMRIRDGADILVEVRNKDLTWPEEMCSLVKAAKPSAEFYVSAPPKPTESEGLTTLTNLGNTCYMNSAIQCVSHTSALRAYFQAGLYNYELNITNVLGMKGNIALEYARLLQELWSSNARVIHPVKFKFNDINQHDCQELLSFLLDGLHEDLNRVHLKPYVELKDSDGRPDQIVASEAWENHLRRNRSVIVDLFHGLLKSSVRCKECNNASVRFDPFTYLTLPLPYEHFLFVQVVVILMDGSLPVKYGLRLGQDDRVFALKAKLAVLTERAAEQFLFMDIYPDSKIRCFLEDRRRLKDYNCCLIYAFECPPSPLTICCSDSRSSSCDQPQANGGPSVMTNGRVLNGSVATTESESNSSTASSRSSSPVPEMRGFTIGIHRKMDLQDVYFLSHNRFRPQIFGLPLVLPADAGPNVFSGASLYNSVSKQIARLLCPLPQKTTSNHALDGDDTLYSKYPFSLRLTKVDGINCAICPWYKFCYGCLIRPDEGEYWTLGKHQWIAIDWNITALHLRYQRTLEKAFVEHPSVAEVLSIQSEPINLDTCLRSFMSEEQLYERDTYHCAKCRKHCEATKQLSIWKLPPILIVHFKRFQCIRDNVWVKSCKVVNFPVSGFDPSTYLVSNSLPPDWSASGSSSQTNASDWTDSGHETSSNSAPSLVLPTPPYVVESSSALSECGGDMRSSSVVSDSNTTSGVPVPPSSDLSLQNGKMASAALASEDSNAASCASSSESPFIPCNPCDHHLLPGFDPSDLKYDLYAYVCHSGHIGAGHYVCYVKQTDGRWFLFNDSSRKELKPEEMEQNSAYILFYERRGLDQSKYMPEIGVKTSNLNSSSETAPSVANGSMADALEAADLDVNSGANCSLM